MSLVPDERAEARAFLPQVESLRGFAAIAVAYSHCGIALIFGANVQRGWIEYVFRGWVLRPIGWATNGEAAVITFFVISGLVLGLALDAKPAYRAPGAYIGFGLKRVFRLYPAHLVALALFVPFAALTIFRVPVLDPAQLATLSSGLKPWVDGTVYAHPSLMGTLKTGALHDNYYNPVTWTLQVEILACLFLPFFAALSARGRWWIDIGVLAILVGVAVALDSQARPDLVPLYLPAFYAGCMARTHGRRFAALLGRVRGGQGLGFVACFLLLVGPAAALGPDQARLAIVLDMVVAGFGLVSIIAWGTSPVLSRIMLNPVSRAMGRLSYSFYLWHDLVLFGFTRLLFATLLPATLARWDLAVLLGAVLVTMPLSFAIAALSYRWIERPFVAFGRYLAGAGLFSRLPAWWRGGAVVLNVE
ncbi:MAG: acyltransferase [Sphingomonas sp.]